MKDFKNGNYCCGCEVFTERWEDTKDRFRSLPMSVSVNV